MNKEELIEFENGIKELYLASKIPAPVHFCSGNEEQLIEIFKIVSRDDWVFSTHRSHFHALLKGIPREWVKSEICAKRSIHLMNKEHKFLTSAIVGGCLPIAVGVAMAIKMRGEHNHVWVFIGDMCAETGIFHECTKYAARNDLPITFVIEDNGLSVYTPTQKVWGESTKPPDIIRYSYVRDYPHHGTGQFISFCAF